jgi:hypothetical protein
MIASDSDAPLSEKSKLLPFGGLGVAPRLKEDMSLVGPSTSERGA